MLDKIFAFLNKDKVKNTAPIDKKVEGKGFKRTYYQSISIINQKVYMYDDDSTLVLDAKFEHVNVEPIKVESLYNQNPDEILYDLKQISKSVLGIEVERLEYINNGYKYAMIIKIYPKYENQQIALPSYLKKTDSKEFDIDSKFYNDFFELLEDKFEKFILINNSEEELFLTDYDGKIVSFSTEPNAPLYFVWDSYGDNLILVEIGKPKTTKTISVRDTTIYRVTMSEQQRRLTLK